MSVRLNLGIATTCALRRFSRDQKGASAIEFALIAIPFLMMLFAIIETALMYFAAQAMETATQDAARLIMTGQAQMQGMSASTFKTKVCAKLSALLDCAGGLDVEVKSYPNFGSVNPTSPISSGSYVKPSAYEPGHAGDIVLVRTFYQWPVFVSGLGYNPANINGKRLLAAAATFRNEPGPF